jgi:membrane protein DedA with SNARE-associated domain
MVSLQPLTDAVLAFVQQYGYVALFVFIILETAWIIHFVPSEIIIPIAAIGLVSDPVSFAVFVTIMTVGAVLGSVLAYYLFGRYGDYVLKRYGHVLRIPESELDRSKRWFRRYGEGFLLWGRLVPVVRTPISIPAGYAETPVYKFLAYSTVGWGLYNTVLVALVYSTGGAKSPLEVGIAAAEPAWEPLVTFTQGSPLAALLVFAMVGGASVLAWTRRADLARTFT